MSGKILSVFICISLFSWIFSLYGVFAAEVLPGDVNSDGKVSSEDARIILRYSVGIENVPEGIKTIADLDGNGNIGAQDARIALRLSIGLDGERIASRSVPGGKIIGYTAKNYPVYSVNGLIYIDGILIANKTYSLPESYDPGNILSDCSEAFLRMQNDAACLGLSIYISSGYRSFTSQKSIYNRYVSRDGKYLADTYSARPGHSEHQTGLAVDLNTITRSFGNTAEGKWVAAHCHEYGFIIRYPEGKSHITGYCYEPWHLRYVGVDTAKKIAASGLCIEEYYGITSIYS